jgi:phosphate transport system substrate-binding protein
VQNFAIDLNDQMGEGSWPIESATFVLLPTNPSNPAQSAAVMKFFDWGFTNGNDIATSLLYVPLPKTIQDAVRAAWKNGLKG